VVSRTIVASAAICWIAAVSAMTASVVVVSRCANNTVNAVTPDRLYAGREGRVMRRFVHGAIIDLRIVNACRDEQTHD
jgi:hypothetical protein